MKNYNSDGRVTKRNEDVANICIWRSSISASQIKQEARWIAQNVNIAHAHTHGTQVCKCFALVASHQNLPSTHPLIYMDLRYRFDSVLCCRRTWHASMHSTSFKHRGRHSTKFCQRWQRNRDTNKDMWTHANEKKKTEKTRYFPMSERNQKVCKCWQSGKAAKSSLSPNACSTAHSTQISTCINCKKSMEWIENSF